MQKSKAIVIEPSHTYLTLCENINNVRKAIITSLANAIYSSKASLHIFRIDEMPEDEDDPMFCWIESDSRALKKEKFYVRFITYNSRSEDNKMFISLVDYKTKIAKRHHISEFPIEDLIEILDWVEWRSAYERQSYSTVAPPTTLFIQQGEMDFDTPGKRAMALMNKSWQKTVNNIGEVSYDSASHNYINQ